MNYIITTTRTRTGSLACFTLVYVCMLLYFYLSHDGYDLARCCRVGCSSEPLHATVSSESLRGPVTHLSIFSRLLMVKFHTSAATVHSHTRMHRDVPPVDMLARPLSLLHFPAKKKSLDLLQLHFTVPGLSNTAPGSYRIERLQRQRGGGASTNHRSILFRKASFLIRKSSCSTS